jgi:hypothetical protein
MASAVETYAYGVARNLGIKVLGSAVEAVALYCEERVTGFAETFACATLEDLRLATANGVKTSVVTIVTDEDLARVEAAYIARKEPGFVSLTSDLGPGVFGQTVRLLTRAKGERPFVSIIDARGDKAARAGFTEWHEYAHLLTLTDPALAKFQRSHDTVKPPAEALMDIIAGRIGFLTSVFTPHLPPTLSFSSIAALRTAACPGASWTSLFNALARVWPDPVVAVRAQVEVKRAQKVPAGQGSFGFAPPPVGVLRAVQAIGNAAARDTGFRIHPNMRVPKNSAIALAASGGGVHEGAENLSQWESAQGGSLESWPIRVIARATAGGVDALIVAEPADH